MKCETWVCLPVKGTKGVAEVRLSTAACFFQLLVGPCHVTEMVGVAALPFAHECGPLLAGCVVVTDKGTVGVAELPLSMAACCFPLLVGPCHGTDVAGNAALPLSTAVGACELPVGRGWGRDSVGAAALPLPTRVGAFRVSVG